MRLNVGSGWDEIDGFLNLDLHAFHHPDVIGDVRSLPIRTGSLADVRAFDVLEHIPRTDTERALQEWARALKPGGRLRMQVPDLPGLLRMLAADTIESHHDVNQLLYGTQAYTGDFHQAGFTDLILADVLCRSGFCDVDVCLRAGWLADVVATRVTGGSHESPVAVSWCHGFYERETDGETVWYWAGSDAELRLINPSGAAVEVRLEAGLMTHSERVGTVELAGVSTRVDRDGGYWAATVTAPPGATSIPVRTDLPRIDPAVDARDLRVAILQPRTAVIAG